MLLTSINVKQIFKKRKIKFLSFNIWCVSLYYIQLNIAVSDLQINMLSFYLYCTVSQHFSNKGCIWTLWLHNHWACIGAVIMLICHTFSGVWGKVRSDLKQLRNPTHDRLREASLSEYFILRTFLSFINPWKLRQGRCAGVCGGASRLS